MNKEPTLEDITQLLEEIEDTMDTVRSAAALENLSAVYASAYAYKLRLMAREKPHAGR